MLGEAITHGDRYSLYSWGSELRLEQWIPVEKGNRVSGYAYIEIRRCQSEPICLIDHKGDLVSTTGIVGGWGNFGWAVWDRYYEEFLRKARGYWDLVKEKKREDDFPRPDITDLAEFQAMVRKMVGWKEGDPARFNDDPCAWDIKAIFE